MATIAQKTVLVIEAIIDNDKIVKSEFLKEVKDNELTPNHILNIDSLLKNIRVQSGIYTIEISLNLTGNI